jgi:hypothetical protein
MARACALNADHVASLPKGYLGDLIATLDSERLARSAAHWIAQPGADIPTCVLNASLRLEISRIALQAQMSGRSRNLLHIIPFDLASDALHGSLRKPPLDVIVAHGALQHPTRHT